MSQLAGEQLRSILSYRTAQSCVRGEVQLVLSFGTTVVLLTVRAGLLKIVTSTTPEAISWPFFHEATFSVPLPAAVVIRCLDNALLFGTETPPLPVQDQRNSPPIAVSKGLKSGSSLHWDLPRR